MEIISREIATENKWKYYFTGKSCKRNHICERYTKSGMCVKCQKFHNSKINPDKNRINSQKWRNENPEKAKTTHKKGQRRYLNTSTGKLRKLCTETSKRLKCKYSVKKKIELLEYDSNELQKHLLQSSYFGSINEAHQANYHIDHIVPIFYISKHIPDLILAFKIAMDLKNLRLIKAEENYEKHKKINLPIVQNTIKYLNKKYNVNIPFSE
jgi:DNA repair ATPase RecN